MNRGSSDHVCSSLAGFAARLVVVVAVVLSVCADSALSDSAAAAEHSSVEVIRDTWGIPHVFAATDVGAMYGLGYATAEDRGFQMYYSLRVIQGRLAEVIGNKPKVGRKGTAIESDRKMRTFGFYRAAQRVAAHLDDESKAFLQAYSDGVNAYFREHQGELYDLFQKWQLEPEPWTPADCVLAWWHIAQFFGTDGTRDLNASRGPSAGRGAGRSGGRGTSRGRPGLLRRPAPVGDEAAAVVGRSDVSAEWIQRVNQFLAAHGIAVTSADPTEAGPKFSHAWVVGGKMTTTGSTVLVSDPQTLVCNPSMFYEFHVQGKTFNARGIGVPGSPIILIGFSDKVAWGMTALGADQADLFRLKTDPKHPDQYFFDGQWHDMEVVQETIRVKGGQTETYPVRWTRFGPVVTDYVFARPGEGEFAVKRIPVCDTDKETIQGAIAMMRAGDAMEFGRALAGWRFPSANVVFGDTDGIVGYWVLGALPVRSGRAPQAGRFPHDGSASEFDWQGFLPHELKPHLINPQRGYVFSANHRPVGSFYKGYIGSTTGAMGDTLRSFRLRELIAGRDRFSPKDVLQVHYSSVNPARRDFVRVGYYLRDVLKHELSPNALQALDYLKDWHKRGCPSDLNVRGAELAMEINTLFRIVSTELAFDFGGGETGLSLFLKDIQRRLEAPKKAVFKPLEIQFVDSVLSRAWQSAMNKYGANTNAWPSKAREALRQRRLGFYQSLDGFPSLDPAQDLPMPDLACVDGATIRSQAAQAYTQFVPMDDVDQAQTILPIGTSERPGAPSRLATLKLWESSQLHPAPLSRFAVDAVAESRTELNVPTGRK